MKYLFPILVFQWFLFHDSYCLTIQEQQNILNEHNHFRRLVAQGKVFGQPRAGNMLEMKWNNESAAIAQRKANTCIITHDEVKDRLYGTHTLVGQNTDFGASRDFEISVDYWFEQQASYTFSSNSCDGLCDVYKQVVWANSNELGCGDAYCKGPRTNQGYGFFLVCNYAPGGNIHIERPYVEGNACSKCPANKKCSNDLCA